MYVLAVNVVHDAICISCSIIVANVLLHPADEMVLERPFDHLMEEIGG